MLNRMQVIGRFTKDPELKYTPSGTAVLNGDIAHNERYKTKEGEEREHVLFLPIVAWGKTAEFIVETCHKGSRVYVEGKLREEKWQNKEGENRRKIILNLDNIYLLDPKPNTGGEE